MDASDSTGGSSFSKKLKQIRWRWVIFVAALIAVILILALRPKEPEHFATVSGDPETTPTMATLDARSLISDSGYTRYMIEAPIWLIFDEASVPHWLFDQGLYLEKYDDSMRVTATFVCDSARYLSQPKIWEFNGNVRIRNESGDRFLTQQMHWDTSNHKLYSDSFIHIEKADRIIEGYGFTSDERIEEYTVNRPSMILPVSDFNRVHEPADTLAANPSGAEAISTATHS